MISLSPIVKKDIEVRSRSYTLPAMITAANAVLFLIGLMGTFGLVARMRQSFDTLYRSFLTVYTIVALTEFIITLFTAPLFTAASISGERETGTFDLLLTTNLTPVEIVTEKLISAMLSMGMIIMSSFPALLIPLMFGGVGIIDTFGLLILFLPGAFLMLSIGMFTSSICSSVTKSIALSYVIAFILTVGFAVFPLMTRVFSSETGNEFAYLLTLDPFLPVVSVLSRQVGEPDFMELIFRGLKLAPDNAFMENTVFISILLQLCAAFGFITLAVMNVMPGRYREKNRKIRER